METVPMAGTEADAAEGPVVAVAGIADAAGAVADRAAEGATEADAADLAGEDTRIVFGQIGKGHGIGRGPFLLEVEFSREFVSS
jgi:hypothetical protein